jgi:hypothetical protein
VPEHRLRVVRPQARGVAGGRAGQRLRHLLQAERLRRRQLAQRRVEVAVGTGRRLPAATAVRRLRPGRRACRPALVRLVDLRPPRRVRLLRA